MIRTFDTRLDLRAGESARLSSVVDDYATLMRRAERLLMAELGSVPSRTGVRPIPAADEPLDTPLVCRLRI
jgi:hypothetical protein